MYDDDLYKKIERARAGFEAEDPDVIIRLVREIGAEFLSDEIREYLSGKLEGFDGMNAAKKREFARQFLPYLDWYLRR